ncbi:MAG: single-stranded-DNA-specific exonuclease RecJ [Planctomycetes bacterium]|nr:single-stranded-DNA-specific exonuclease RecJ [Planctomycetota bacterium]
MVNQLWQVRGTSADADSLAQALRISPVTTQILINRGISSPAGIKSFLNPDLNSLIDPYKIPGIASAVERINQAIRNKEKIFIYGDYDVDGITSVCLLVKLFKLFGVNANYYIPHRLEENYGLNCAAIDEIAKQGAKLIITVDCGISSIDEVTYAGKLGIDVIITDHHQPDAADKLPEAAAVINPKLPGGPSECSILAGVGVAFKLAWALTSQLSDADKAKRQFHDFLMDAMTLTAVGTVADVAPLIGENRVFTYYGLESLKRTNIGGLKALMETSGVTESDLKAYHIAYRIAPRLNAGGRLANAYSSAELLLIDSQPRITELADYLEETNRQRQKIETKILDEARQMVKKMDLDTNFMIVLSSESWHPGVVGIVASRVAREFHRPAVLISLDNQNGKRIGRGSARSIPNFHLYDALNNCRHLLASFGGHERAAGLEIEIDRIPEFTALIQEQTRQYLKDEKINPALVIDAEVDFAAINDKLVNEIERLAPFGEGNPEPVLVSHNLTLAGTPRLMGRNSEHLSFFVTTHHKDTKTIKAFRVIAYKFGNRIELIQKMANRKISIVYTLKMNRWRGQDNIELELKDIKAGSS